MQLEPNISFSQGCRFSDAHHSIFRTVSTGPAFWHNPLAPQSKQHLALCSEGLGSLRRVILVPHPVGAGIAPQPQDRATGDQVALLS